MSDYWQPFLYACISALSAALARAGLNARMSVLESEMASLRGVRDAILVDTNTRISQMRSEFLAEVDDALRPMNETLKAQGEAIAEIATMVSTIVNRGNDEPINRGTTKGGA